MEPGTVDRVKRSLGEGRRVVVFLHPNIGDVVNLTAVLRWLSALCPSSHIVVVTSPVAAPIAEASGFAAEVWTRPEGFFERQTFLSRLRNGKFDISLHCQGQNTILRLAKRAGIPCRIGVFGTKHRAWLDLGVEWREGEREQPETVGRLLGALGADVSDSSPVFEIQEGARRRALEVLRLEKDSGQGEHGPFVAFMVGASHSAKAWPLERFGEVARMVANYGQVVLIGGPREALATDSIGLSSAINLAGKLTVLESAAVLEHCELLVTNDSGPMHLAGAVGTPVVGMFGPTSKERFRPYGDGHVLLQGDCGCPFRDLDTCSGDCLRTITQDRVTEAVDSVLARTTSMHTVGKHI